MREPPHVSGPLVAVSTARGLALQVGMGSPHSWCNVPQRGIVRALGKLAAPMVTWQRGGLARSPRMRSWTGLSGSSSCAGGRGDERAAHEPLLLLYALGQFQRNGDTPIPLQPGRRATRPAATRVRAAAPDQPRLPVPPPDQRRRVGGQNRIWRRQSGRQPEGAAQPAGRGLPGFRSRRALRRDPLLAQLAHVLLDIDFEPSLHDDICAAVGLDLEKAATPGPQRDKRRHCAQGPAVSRVDYRRDSAIQLFQRYTELLVVCAGVVL